MEARLDFFDPNAGTSRLFAMGGAGHLALNVILLGLVVLAIVFRGALERVRENRRLMVGAALVVLLAEATSYALKFIYPFEPGYERIPLHLCSTLKIALAVLVLLRREDLLKFISLWAIASGFISFANLNLEGQSFDKFMFWHYLVGHYYLFLLPLLYFLTGAFRYDLRYFARSAVGLFLWSLVILVVDWAFDANFMYFGPHNTTAVPFVPDQCMVWPFGYVSFVIVGVILLSAIFGLLRLGQRWMDRSRAHGF